MSFKVLLRKEILSVLKNPQVVFGILLVPVVFIAMGGLVGAGVRTAIRVSRESPIPVLCCDTSPYAWRALEAANASMNGRIVAVGSIDEALQGYGLVVIIPPNFTEQVKSEGEATLRALVALDVLSITSSARMGLVNVLADALSDALSLNGTSRVKVEAETTAILGGLKLSGSAMEALASALMNLGFAVAIVIALGFNFGALSMAQEKEEKTFEVLLSQPVPRLHIGLAKVVGVVVISLIEAAVFWASWMYYASSLALEGPLPSLTASSMAALFANVVVAMIVAATLGLILGGLARDTRAAGIIVGPFWFLAMIAVLAAFIIGLPLDPVSLAALSATIVLSPVVVIVAGMLGYTWVIIAAIALTALESLVAVLILAKLLESERLIVGWGLSRITKRD